MEPLQRIISQHPFFAGLDLRSCDVICECAREVTFAAGEFLLREGDPADEFYLLQEGRVALEVTAPGRGTLAFQTLGRGEIVGISWLIPPYRWTYDARALEETRAIALDARCIRDQCEADHDLGYEMMKRVMPSVIQRLQATRLQTLDVYGATD